MSLLCPVGLRITQNSSILNYRSDDKGTKVESSYNCILCNFENLTYLTQPNCMFLVIAILNKTGRGTKLGTRYNSVRGKIMNWLGTFGNTHFPDSSNFMITHDPIISIVV